MPVLFRAFDAQTCLNRSSDTSEELIHPIGSLTFDVIKDVGIGVLRRGDVRVSRILIATPR